MKRLISLPRGSEGLAINRKHSGIVFLVSLFLAGCASQSYAPVVRLGTAPRPAPQLYRVKRGDTLYSIAWAYGLDYRKLAMENRLSSAAQIWPGQRLSLKQGVSTSQKLSSQKKACPSRVSSHAVIRGWAWPTKGQVIQGFKPGFAGNAGLDIKGVLGQPVRAAHSGTVVYSGHGVRGYGNLIIIKHSNDFLSAYAFNKRNRVPVGARVSRGQEVAVMGKNNGGLPVLHFEIRQDGRPVNPLRFLH